MPSRTTASPKTFAIALQPSRNKYRRCSGASRSPKNTVGGRRAIRDAGTDRKSRCHDRLDYEAQGEWSIDAAGQIAEEARENLIQGDTLVVAWGSKDCLTTTREQVVLPRILAGRLASRSDFSSWQIAYRRGRSVSCARCTGVTITRVEKTKRSPRSAVEYPKCRRSPQMSGGTTRMATVKVVYVTRRRCCWRSPAPADRHAKCNSVLKACDPFAEF